MPSEADSAMPARNLEIKVACDSDGLADVGQRLARLGTPIDERLQQIDTYLRVPNGRLKLRTIAHVGADDTVGPIVRAELIGYERTDHEGSRWSTYHVVAIPPPEADRLRITLIATIGPLVTVTKRRDIAIVKHTRVHLDRVDGLGAFVELETVIAGQADEDAEREHQGTITALGLDRWASMPGSYSDLLLAQRAGTREPKP